MVWLPIRLHNQNMSYQRILNILLIISGLDNLIMEWHLLACQNKCQNQIIGELAPLLSVLGHQMHMRHKTAATSVWIHVAARPIWMCVAALSIVSTKYLPALSIAT